MNHPQVDELTELLYGELTPAREAEVNQHLLGCDECRGRIATWRDVRQDLATWKVPLTGQPRAALPARHKAQFMRWAVAAMVLIGTGFGLAHLVTPRPDFSAVRAELRNELKQELATTLAGYADEQSSRQQAFQQYVSQAVGRIEARQVAEHAILRKDVETVALHTQEEFDRLTAFTSEGQVGQPVER